MTDPGSFGRALAVVGARMATRPGPALRWASRVTAGLAAAGAQSAARALGWEGEPGLAPSAKDRRFSDPAFDDHPWFLGQRQAYLAWSRCMRDLPEAAGMAGPEARKAGFAVDMVVDCLAPTNFLWGNPVALRKAVETRGASVVNGLRNLAGDVAGNHGRPQQVDASAFEVGSNLACTPGKVVYRNDLIELLQYEPTTETVFSVPLLLSPPWINRYYVMDLAPGRSFAEWAVGHGHTTFAISYRNPDSSMRDVGLADYLTNGLGRALEVVQEITGAPQVNLAGLCVGGTLSVMLQAWQAAGSGRSPVRSSTLLNTLLDFNKPGPLAVFTDEASVAAVESRMAEHGFLEGRQMATTFDALRPNDLIWNYVASNWLMGDRPPAFDILAWNADATRIPAATHSEYLRAFYVDNRLAGGSMELAGRPLRLGAVTPDTYVLAAREDHITPWTSSYATTGLLDSSQVRFVLSSAGHIAGIVNPPGPKRVHWVNDTLSPTPDEWMAGAEQRPGTWWDDWASWIEARAGKRRRPPAMGNAEHPVLGDAPGTYVHG